VFLIYHAGRGRKELVYAVKNCRAMGFGRHRGEDGCTVAVGGSREREQQMREYLRGAVLVPVPTSGSGVDEPGDSLWSSRDLARSLAREYDVETQELLHRHTAIDKSSSGNAPRNLRRHIDSVELTGPVPRGTIVLVDDLVATGSTMCGCTEVILAAAPWAQVKGFAVAYSLGASDERLDFAARKYEWDRLDGRPRNCMIPSPLSER